MTYIHKYIHTPVFFFDLPVYTHLFIFLFISIHGGGSMCCHVASDTVKGETERQRETQDTHTEPARKGRKVSRKESCVSCQRLFLIAPKCLT